MEKVFSGFGERYQIRSRWFHCLLQGAFPWFCALQLFGSYRSLTISIGEAWVALRLLRPRIFIVFFTHWSESLLVEQPLLFCDFNVMQTMLSAANAKLFYIESGKIGVADVQMCETWKRF